MLSRARTVVEALDDPLDDAALDALLGRDFPGRRQATEPVSKVPAPTAKASPPAAAPAPAPKPAATAPASPVAPASTGTAPKSGVVTAAVLVGPGLPAGGLYAEGTKREALRQLAMDAEILTGASKEDEDMDYPAGHVHGVIDGQIKNGAMLVLLGGGKVIAISARGLSAAKAHGASSLSVPELAGAIEGLAALPAEKDLVRVSDSTDGDSAIISGARLRSADTPFNFRR